MWHQSPTDCCNHCGRKLNTGQPSPLLKLQQLFWLRNIVRALLFTQWSQESQAARRCKGLLTAEITFWHASLDGMDPLMLPTGSNMCATQGGVAHMDTRVKWKKVGMAKLWSQKQADVTLFFACRLLPSPAIPATWCTDLPTKASAGRKRKMTISALASLTHYWRGFP